MGKKLPRDGRTTDMQFTWLVNTYGNKWLQWQEMASAWMKEQDRGIDAKRYAVASFFEVYLLKSAPYAINVADLFRGRNGHRCSSSEYMNSLNGNGLNGQEALTSRANDLCSFIDWVIERYFSVKEDNGALRPIVTNPFTRVKQQVDKTETVRNPLPYRYIQSLRELLCPMPSQDELRKINQSLQVGEVLLPAYQYRSFKHWTWAQKQTGQSNNVRGDWFDVDPSLIDKSDPDCVWRKKEVTRRRKLLSVYQMWSPVKAMVAFVKLHLPLRTYQVRFLDSGEADTWRYANGVWVENTLHDFALGTPKRVFEKGVFKRIYDSMLGQYSTGLYISTNKTADINKGEADRGYTIPWQNEEVLYWLEKLRNWQEKYNPISSPTSFSTLQKKHFGNGKSNKIKAEMGDSCFLFRQPSNQGDDRYKPIISDALKSFWYHLLLTLQNQLKEQGDTLKDGSSLKLVENYPEGTEKTAMRATLFPMHSLRVSLITAYTMDTDMPLPVISKLLAGHTRLLMTIYYNKITPSMMAEKMIDAEAQLEEKSQDSVRNFLKDASMEQIECKMVYHKENSIKAALANRNPVGWEYRAYGLCLVGGNSAILEDVRTVGGCWNGGELIRSASNARDNIFASVPHGPENCIRCRWFITEARFLPALNANFNQLSYKSHQASNLAIEIEGELDALKDEQFFCEEQGQAFTKHSELQALQRRYEKQKVEADEYAKDWIACFELINKIIRIEDGRVDNDTKDKLIAVGTERDVSHALKFIETESELLHLSLLCEDAEFYPDLQDELRKTSAIEKRSRQLNRVLMRKGFEPIFMEMDDKQQLIAANAMLRQMAKIADPDDKLEGYRKVANYIEAGEYLKDNKLFSEGISALTDNAIRLENINTPALLEE